MWTQGRGDLVHQLLAGGLVDELRLQIYPVILGHGKRLFDDGAQASAFTLLHSASTPNGMLIAHDVRGSEVRTGTLNETM